MICVAAYGHICWWDGNKSASLLHHCHDPALPMLCNYVCEDAARRESEKTDQKGDT